MTIPMVVTWRGFALLSSIELRSTPAEEYRQQTPGHKTICAQHPASLTGGAGHVVQIYRRRKQRQVREPQPDTASSRERARLAHAAPMRAGDSHCAETNKQMPTHC